MFTLSGLALLAFAFVATLTLAFYIYLFYLFYYYIYLHRSCKIDESSTTGNTYTIVVASRNEEDNILDLLNSLTSQQNIQSYEINIIDDASDDNTYKIVYEYIMKYNIDNITLIHQSEYMHSPKKAALTKGIQLAENNTIVTTDADCEMGCNWLSSIDGYFSDNVSVVQGPMQIRQDNSTVLTSMQVLETCSLAILTGASFQLGIPLMANGGNLAYRRDTFLQVNGFESSNRIVSGDDDLLIDTIRKDTDKKIVFMDDILNRVFTKPLYNMYDIIQQKLRWSSKLSAYGISVKGIFLSLVPFKDYLIALCLFINPIYSIVLAIVDLGASALFAALAINHYRNKISWRKFFVSLIAYRILIFILPFIKIFKAGYNWKGRKLY